MTITVAVSLDANSPCAIKWQPYNEDVYYLIRPGETVDAIHKIKGSGRIWHSAYDPLAGTESDTFIKDLPAAEAYCAGSADTMGNSKYTGSVNWAYCDDGNPNTVDITILTAPDIAAQAPAAVLHLVTVPTGAMAIVGGQELGGTTDQEYRHTFPAGVYKEKVAVIISLKHFKDKKFKKTLYAGLNEYALYILSTATKIKGKTKKSNAAGAASFTFTLHKKTGSKAQIVEAGMNLRLLNMANGQVKQLTTDAMGVATITISYEDEFFEAGKQKLVCSLEGSADRIRTFKSIKVSKVTGDAVGVDEEWHDDNENETDDITSTSDGRSVAIDAAYARIGQ